MRAPAALSRRKFLALAASGAFVARLRVEGRRRIPLGILLYAIQAQLDRDFEGTLAAVAAIGFAGVEFTHCFDWSPGRAREVRDILDRCGLCCFSTHGEAGAFTPEGLKHAIELSGILGSPAICCVRGLEPASSGAGRKGPMLWERAGVATWEGIADALEKAAGELRPLGMICAFHNHAVEFAGEPGKRPIDVLAGREGLKFHVDVNACRSAGSDPAAFIRRHPARLDALLLTDGPRGPDRRIPLLGDGSAPWKEIFTAAEMTGGVRCYLLAQAGGGLAPMTGIRREWQQYQRIRGS